MHIKKHSTVLFTTCFIASIILVSCESHEQRPDAFDIVKQEKLEPMDSALRAEEAAKETKKKKNVLKKEVLNEWGTFSLETEKKIRSNESKIREIKGTVANDAKLLRKVERLEKENNDLRRLMNEYTQEVKEKWETFKTEMDQSVSGIDIELKDITRNNKK